MRLNVVHALKHAETLWWLGRLAVDLPEPADVAERVGKYDEAAIDAVGCEARGSAMQRATGIRPFKLHGASAVALHWAINSVRKGGVVSIVGAYGPVLNAVSIGSAMNKGITVIEK